jgi:hypothetical protein
MFWSAWARSLNNNVESSQRKILYETDHRAVLEAGRQVLADSSTFSSELPTASLPKILHDLKPSYVEISPDRLSVHVEMGGGFFHFGYDIYREGAKGSGTKELIPGLWYYSEDGAVIPQK